MNDILNYFDKLYNYTQYSLILIIILIVCFLIVFGVLENQINKLQNMIYALGNEVNTLNKQLEEKS